MTRKAILKMAGYEVMCDREKSGANCFWYIRDSYIESQYYQMSETRAWTSAWEHFKKCNTPKESNT